MVTVKEDLIQLFRKLGLKTTDDVMVHSSMRSLGHVVNGAVDVIDALTMTVGLDKGTILMPAHTGQLTDPSDWTCPPLDKKSIAVVKEKMNPLDLKLTPVRGRGVVAQSFLSFAGVKRSSHPLNSVSALGKRASFYTDSHDFDEPEGLDSPIGKLYENNGKVLGIGVGVSRFTAIHLAEYIADLDYLKVDNPSVLFKRENQKNIFKRIKKYPGESDRFTNILPILRKRKLITELEYNGHVMTCLSIKPVIDCIVNKLKKNSLFLIS
ncbi:AAC(3) family N-acetyltransferase [bacterium]|jgi:aminoglycoside 3-N-acetyltransferase|nr:AAC(3) family N-acetyltransferase [bacterium]